MKNQKSKEKTSTQNIFIKFLLGFLIPYLLINGIIFFFYTEVPLINIKEQEDKQLSKIEFSIDSKLPIIDIQVTYDNEVIPYTKNGNTYFVDAVNNGTYKITAKAINQMSAVASYSIESLDEVAPIIHTDSAIIANGTITVKVTDENSKINYSALYGLDEEGNMINPIFVDEASGTIQFNVMDLSSITIHVEDIEGNGAETNISF